MRKTAVIAVLAAFNFCACKKSAPENVPLPKTDAAGAAPAVSTGAPTGVRAGSPAEYLKTTVGHVGEARAAKALFEKTAKQELDALDLNKAGGN